jgi:hypothetical protein
MALAVEMFYGFRADEPAGTGNQNCLWLHLKSLLLLIEVGRAINIMRQIPRICIHGRAERQTGEPLLLERGRQKLLSEKTNPLVIFGLSPVRFQPLHDFLGDNFERSDESLPKPKS